MTNDPESEQGYDAMFSRLPPSDDYVNEVVLFRAPGKDVTTDPEVRGEVERLAAALEATGRTAQSRDLLRLERRGAGLARQATRP